MNLLHIIASLLLILFSSSFAFAKEIQTNEISCPDAPSWVTAARLNRIADKVSRVLEWNIQRVTLKFYSDLAEFQKAHGLPGVEAGVNVLAVTKSHDNSILIGPKVQTDNFDGVFGHELAHVIINQKYKSAIPKWLEEGLANHAGNRGVIDYKHLASQKEFDVKSMVHPIKDGKVSAKTHYMASSALIQMLASKCSLQDLLQLSVGEGLEHYLETFCRISDLNAEFRKWVNKKANQK